MATDAIAEPTKLKLYSYWRSSCSCRVRIALNLKGLDYEYIAVNLLKGEQKSPEFLKLNPLGLVPVLIDGDTVVSDSLAILLYLEEKYPQRPLLPRDLELKALNYQAANIVFASIQPYQNIPIIGYVKDKLGADEMLSWVQHHIKHGFAALEKLLDKFAGKYATGDEVFLADLYLAPQIDGAVRRFSVDMNEFPLLSKFNEAYKQLPAFQNAMPGKQLDTPPEARD
ncbi:glutathione S-transferase 2-like [Salvia splendens]|uniref:glutathione S-transferase 2-like n=1 Tax=Salvia splendens TaxID=180675 RepID=UPI001C252934|nr:glutathione S-transferase 2-like [Salvia splendens]XP_042030462.1 glutathione S-transferase 2-like [Salvia splendens]